MSEVYHDFEEFFYEKLPVELKLRDASFGYEYGSETGVHDPGPIIEREWNGSREIDVYLVNPPPSKWDNRDEVEVTLETEKERFTEYFSLEDVRIEKACIEGKELTHLVGKLQR